MSGVGPAFPPEVPAPRSIQEIVDSSKLVIPVPEETPQHSVPHEKVKRLHVSSTQRQREVFAEEFARFRLRKHLKSYVERTKLCTRTVKRYIGEIRSGKDITKPVRRGRQPKYTAALFKKIASELCVRNKSLREARRTVIQENADAVASGSEPLPVVSIATMSRYVQNAEVMKEVDIGPLSFTQVTVRGPAANSEANKTLRIERRRQFDAFITAGYTVVFVDESHRSAVNVRTRTWGPKGEKHFRTEKASSVSLSCICSISDSGQGN